LLFVTGGLFQRRVCEVRRIVSILVALVLALGFSLLTAVPVSAAVSVTPASGGDEISADTSVGAPGEAWTELGAIVITEEAAGDIQVGTFTLTIPAGFEFDTVGTAPDVAVVGAGLVAPTPAAITSDNITVTVTSASTVAGTLTIGGGVGTPIKVRPIVGTPLASVNITMTDGTIIGVDGTTNFGTLNEVAGAVNTLTILVQPTDTAAHANITPSPQVKATDAFNNPIDNKLIAVALFGGTETLSGTSPQSANVSGIATFADLSIDEMCPSRQLKFTADGAHVDSDPFNVTAGPVTQLAIFQQPAGSVSGVALTTQPIVEAQDQYGNVNTYYVGNIVAATNDAGTLTGTLSVAVVSGTATFTDLVYTATADHEIFQIYFTSPGLTGDTSDDVSCNVVGTKLVFIQQPAGSISGVVLTTQPIVAAQDANNVTDTDYVTNIVAVTNGPGTLTGTTAVTPVAGVATFTDLVYTATADQEIFQIYFTPPGLTGATSNDVVCAVLGVGGGISSPSGSGSLNLAPYLNLEGKAMANINLNSTNGLVTIGIPLGTQLLDAQGNPLGNIQIVTLSTPPPPPDYVLVGHAYDCLPDGATFKPAITLIFKYTEADIPDGVSEEDLVLAYWDGSQWVNLTTTVNVANNTATAKVAHFTPFAILAYLGAPAFATSDLSGTFAVKEAAPPPEGALPEAEEAKPLNPWVVVGMVAAVIVVVLVVIMLGRRRA
jgi:hypothetical protein